KALATGALAARDTGRQEALWHASSSAQQQVWLDRRKEVSKLLDELSEAVRAKENIDQNVKARETARTENEREHRRRLRIVKLRQRISMLHHWLHHWSVGLRLWIDPR